MRRRRSRLLWAVPVVVLLVLRRRRRRASAEPAPLPPAVPAVPEQTAAVRPSLSDRLRNGVPVPGRPRVSAVHAGSLRHDDLSQDLGEVALPVGRTLVGRDPSCDLCLDHPTVSPRHLALDVAPHGAVILQDLGTVNGTTVDGVPVLQATLYDGNRLDLGEVQLVFHREPDEDDGGRQGGEGGEQPHQRQAGRD